MKHKSIPLLYSLIQGSIGKNFVVKHYGKRVVITKFPDMNHIQPTVKQLKQHELFRNAVKYAKEIIADPGRKADWQKRLKRKNGVYNAAIKAFMLREKKAKQKRLIDATSLLRIAMVHTPEEKMMIAAGVENSVGFELGQTHFFSTTSSEDIAINKNLLTCFNNKYPPEILFNI